MVDPHHQYIPVTSLSNSKFSTSHRTNGNLIEIHTERRLCRCIHLMNSNYKYKESMNNNASQLKKNKKTMKRKQTKQRKEHVMIKKTRPSNNKPSKIRSKVKRTKGDIESSSCKRIHNNERYLYSSISKEFDQIIEKTIKSQEVSISKKRSKDFVNGTAKFGQENRTL